MIKFFKNKLTTLKEILKDKNEIQEIRDLYFAKEENIKKRIIELRTRKDEELDLAWERSSTIYDEIELREKIQERID